MVSIIVLREIGLSISGYVPGEKEENGYFISKSSAVDLFRKYPELVLNTIEIISNIIKEYVNENN